MAEKLKKKEKDLQVALIQAVYYGHSEAVKGAGEALNEHFKKYESPKAKKKSRLPIIPGLEGPKQKTTGPQMLDFLVERLYDAEAKTWRKEIPKKCRSDYNRRSPLMIALQEVVVADTARTEDRTELAKQLIALGASVAFKNKVGLTALHIACSTGQEEMVRLILETAKKQTRFCHRKGDKKNLDSDLEAVLNAKGPKWGWTALMFAVKEGHLNIVKILMEYDILDYGKENKKQQNVFHVAAREGQPECLKQLCTKSPPELLLTSDWKEWNIIHQVCSNGDVGILKWLLGKVPQLKTEPYLNKKSKMEKYQTGYTPLLVACFYHKLEIVKYLTEGVDPGLVDVTACCHEDKKGRGKNGLHLSAENYAVEVAKQLIKAGCPLDKVDAKGNTVLHIANRRGDYSVARVVTAKCLEEKIKLEIENDDGKLPGQMVEEVIIPLEIKKRGEHAIEIYMKALNEGKTKIPYCSLLILGKQEVGKTSLYRQLVGKEFLEEIDSTRGIDNNTVDTVDRRNVDTKKEKWLEMEDPDTGEQFGERLAAKVTTELPKKADKEVSDGKSVTEKELLTSIEHIVRDIERLKRPVPRTTPVFQATPIPAPSHTSSPPAKKVRFSAESAEPPQPPPAPRPSAEVVRDEPPKRAAPKPKPPPVPVPTPAPPPPPAAEVKERTATPSTSEEEEEEEEDFEPPPGILTHRQSSQLDEFFRGKRELPVELSLTLNTLDFAGQKQYRPMHHCFIARRALYLVVFNIDDMLKHISDPQGTSPIEEVRYWIQSINAHIYPPDKSEKKADEAVNRVFLVGTHRGDHSQEELKKIDELIESQLIYFPESKCVNHIRSMKVDKPTECNGLDYFVAVENSIDCTKGDAYLEESGTKILQDKIKNVSKKIEFMKEEHPIKWLKFEERLERCGKTRNPPLMRRQEINQLAVNSRIIDEEQKVALKFFHDTGKIICLEYLPCLFLSPGQYEELKSLIVLHPDWLISVMKVIMELDPKEAPAGVKSSLIADLVKTGEADLELLDICWEKLISPSESPPESRIDIRHLCLILQAYCLIYPVQSVDEVNGNNSNGDGVESKQSRKSNYIIPCKLPEKNQKIEEEYPLQNSSAFFFDFNGFLPAEIYHRLICLATRYAKPPPRSPNLYSSKKCLFWKLEKTNWIMEMDSEKHRLCFRVIAKKPKEEYIQFIHDRLCEICEDSRLEGVVYYGGPEIDCKPCKKTVLLHCVEYNNGDTGPLTCKPECSVCLTEYDINDLPVKDPPEVVASDSKQPCTSRPALALDDKKVVFMEIKKAAALWEDIGLALAIEPDALKNIEHDNAESAGRRLSAVVSAWLKGNGGERSWKFLCDGLRGPLVERPDLADAIEEKYIHVM